MNDMGALKSQLILETYKQTVIGPFYIGLAITSIIIYALCVIGMWKLFEKMGEKGWKSIIPIYNMYILFSKVWQVRMFVFWIACLVAFFVLGSLRFGDPWTTVFLTLICVLFVVMFVLHAVLMYKLAMAFGKGIGFFLGLMFFNFIFLIVLGFGESNFLLKKKRKKKTKKKKK